MDYIIYFVITIAILVFIHEFGHFAAAKLCKMRADVFAIGFGKRLFGWNKINGFTFGDLPKDFDTEGNTDYRLCLIPLGGYVKIAGMVDESFDTEFANEEPKPYEFRAKPTYQKLFVITAGVMMNLTLTVAIFWGINFFQGKQVMDTTTIGEIASGGKAAMIGFETNDKILSINNEPVNNWDEVLNNIFVDDINENKIVTVERNNEQLSVTIPAEQIKSATEEIPFLQPGDTKPVITDVMKNSPAEDAGVKQYDLFLSLNSIPLNTSEKAINKNTIVRGYSRESAGIESGSQ